MTTRLSPAELHTLQGQPPRQLSLFKGRRQKGTLPPPPLEFKVHRDVAQALTAFATPGWFWTHFPSGELRDPRIGRKLKLMGMKPGMPDFVLFAPNGGQPHFLELKRKGGRMTPAQTAFELWCHDNRVRHYVAFNCDQALTMLIEWGALRMEKVETMPFLKECARVLPEWGALRGIA